MICVRCQETIPDVDEVFEYYGKKMCEDCYVGTVQPPKSCDPTAVYSARSARIQSGHSGSDGLTPLQKQIYDFIKERGEITWEEFIKSFDTTKWEMEKQFAILRHCELIRATKKGHQIYITTM